MMLLQASRSNLASLDPALSSTPTPALNPASALTGTLTLTRTPIQTQT